MFKASWGKKFRRSHLNQWLGPVVYACYLSYMGSTKRRIKVQVSLDIQGDCILNITNTGLVE
jgi:hypothetical protein